jgi:Maltokinase N-terminal cap domain
VAFLHNATLVPTKLELLAAWVPTQPWWVGASAPNAIVGAYRFDDPDDQVGIETHLLDAGDGAVVQVPLTYRAAPLDGAEASLITTMQHSALGQRWVYDGCADPVYARALATAILTGGTQAELRVESDKGIVVLEPVTRVAGSGTPGAAVPEIDAVTAAFDGTATTIIAPEAIELVVRRALDDATVDGGQLTLAGRWPGHDSPTILAFAVAR